MPVALLLSVLVPPLVEQLGKTARLYLKQRKADEIAELRSRVEALEALEAQQRWS